MILKADLACSQRPLQEESERQLSKLCLDKCTDGLVGEGEDLLALFFPLVILIEKKHLELINKLNITMQLWGEKEHVLTVEEFSLYLKASW